MITVVAIFFGGAWCAKFLSPEVAGWDPLPHSLKQRFRSRVKCLWASKSSALNCAV